MRLPSFHINMNQYEKLPDPEGDDIDEQQQSEDFTEDQSLPETKSNT